MKKSILIPSALVLSASFIVLFFLVRSHNISVEWLRQHKNFNDILITVDTLPADRIGCYGFPGIETPYMELFASNGIKFERCISQTPLTLPSHASILTGTQPFYHGIRDNGGFFVPKPLTTLAEVFKKNNYRTAAFVASYVLDSKWGLDRGFDYYFDKFDLSRYQTISLIDVQRRADEVINEVLSWLNEHRKEKFFTWVHLYDPHAPYDPPSPFKEKYSGNPYVGEIAYADDQIGRLWRYLNDSNLIKNTVLILTADHGESLGEHQEDTHGFFVYQGTIHVPLIFVMPLKKLQGVTRSPIVSLVDVAPIILDMAGVPTFSQIQGRSLVPLFFKNKAMDGNLAYSETYYPRLHYRRSELKAIQKGPFKLILAPSDELYDVANDPGEATNLAPERPQLGKELRGVTKEFIADFGRGALEQDRRQIDEETRQKLMALGYIGSLMSSSPLGGKNLADPKDKIGVFNRLNEARESGLEGKIDQAISTIKEIIRAEPEITEAYFTLGNFYFQQQKYEESLDYFVKAYEKKPDAAFIVTNIANCYIAMGRIKEAEKALLDSLDSVVPDSLFYLYLGGIKKLLKKYPEAITYLQKCLQLNPYSASGYSELGAIYVIQDELEEAEKYLLKAAAINPACRNLHYNYAQLFEKRGDLARAAEQYRIELDNVPYNFQASYNLSVIYRDQGDMQNEQKYLEKTIEINPNFPLSYFYLARIFLHQNSYFERAIDLVNKGISLKPKGKDLVLAYFLLADLYARLGDDERSKRYLQKGERFKIPD